MSQNSVDSVYGRDALVIYLKDVRDLETIKALLIQKFNDGERQLQAVRDEYLEPNKIPVRKSKILTGCLIYVAFATLGGLGHFFTILSGGGSADASDPVSFGISLVMLFGVCAILFGVIWSRRRKDQKKNEEDDERLRHNAEQIAIQYEQPWVSKKAFLQQAYSRVDAALNDAYSLNIVPGQYRTLASTEYLYEFMSTSRQPFYQALNHAQIEDGIRRIESKLNIIIQQNEMQLRQLAAIRENTETIIEYEKKILVAQVATAYYARAAAVHAKASSTKIDVMTQYARYGF